MITYSKAKKRIKKTVHHELNDLQKNYKSLYELATKEKTEVQSLLSQVLNKVQEIIKKV